MTIFYHQFITSDLYFLILNSNFIFPFFGKSTRFLHIFTSKSPYFLSFIFESQQKHLAEDASFHLIYSSREKSFTDVDELVRF